MDEFYKAKTYKDPNGFYWCVCGKCHRKFWQYLGHPGIHKVMLDTYGGTEIEIKCPSCKTLNRMKI